jgi:hypothetical protein
VNNTLPPSARPVRDVEHGLDWLLAELRARHWVAYWHNRFTGELHEISYAHWLSDDDAEAKYTLRNGFYDPSFKEPGLLNQQGTFHRIFVAPVEDAAQAAKDGTRGRTARVDDYVEALIAVFGHIHLGKEPKLKRQADIERWLKNYFAAKKQTVSKTSIREVLAHPLFRALKLWEAKMWEDEN